MPEFLVRGDSPKIGRDVGTEVENRKMITQALSYSLDDRATHPLPRTGKGGLRPVDFLRLIDAARGPRPALRGVAGAGAARPAAASSSGRESRACRLGSSAAGPAHSAASPVHSAATRMSIAPTSGSNLPRTKYMPSSSGKIEKHLERCRILSSSCSSHRFSRRHALTTR